MRINILILNPNMPAHAPKIKYIVPMSLWLVEYIHRGKMAEFKAINCKFIYELILLLIRFI